jgi:hypothetical protein
MVPMAHFLGYASFSTAFRFKRRRLYIRYRGSESVRSSGRPSLCCGRQTQRDFRGFLGANDDALGPIGEKTMGVSAHVVLAGFKAREFEMAIGVSVGSVGAQTVGCLNRYACIWNGLASLVKDAA